MHEVLIVLTENTLTENDVKSERFPTFNISNLRHRGFGANHNTVFERFESDVFFIVNPDIILNKPLDLDLMVKHILKDRIDISSPQVVGGSGAVEDYKRADLTFSNLLRRKLFKKDIEKFDWLAGMFLVLISSKVSSSTASFLPPIQESSVTL